MRPMTMRQRALLACRPVVLPDEAGSGATPQSCAKLASERSLSGLSPAATRSAPATSGPTPLRAHSSGATSWVRRLPLPTCDAALFQSHLAAGNTDPSTGPTMLDEVSLDVVARARRVGRGFGWGDVLVVAATIIWGVNVVEVKLALTDSGPFTYSAIRYVLGGLALCGLARWLEGPLVRPRGTDAWLIAAAAAGVLVNQAGFAGSL